MFYDSNEIFEELIAHPEEIDTESEEISPDNLLQNLRNGQMVLRSFVATGIQSMDIESESVSRWWPLGKEVCHCMIDPRINFGQPTDSKSGIMLEALYQPFIAGDDVSTIAHWYEVKPEAVRTAILFYESYLSRGR